MQPGDGRLLRPLVRRAVAGGRLFRIDFEVVADRRVGVLAEWNAEFAAILAELGGTAAPVSEWLQANPRAGGCS